MKIALIQPPALQSQDSYSSLTQPPLGLAYLAFFTSDQKTKTDRVLKEFSVKIKRRLSEAVGAAERH